MLFGIRKEEISKYFVLMRQKLATKQLNCSFLLAGKGHL
jgi:hypothetical protein